MTRKANLGFERVPIAQPCPHETAALPPGGKSTITHPRPRAAGGHVGSSLHRASCLQQGAQARAAASRHGLPFCSRPWPGQRDKQAGGVGTSGGPLPPGPPRRAWPSQRASCQQALQAMELVRLGPRKTVTPAVPSGPSKQPSPPPLPWPKPPEQTDRGQLCPWALRVRLAAVRKHLSRLRDQCWAAPVSHSPLETAVTVCLLACGLGHPNRPLPCWWEPGGHPCEAQAFPRTQPSTPLLPSLAPRLESLPALPACFPGWKEEERSDLPPLCTIHPLPLKTPPPGIPPHA